MADVFISYKRRFRPQVEMITDSLRRLGVSVWFDAGLMGGDDFQKSIRKELSEAKCVFVFWSNDCFAADDNGYVTGEAEMGRERRVLVSAMLEPTKLFPPFNVLHVVDLSKWAGPEELGPPSDKNWISALAAIGGKIGRPGLGEYVDASESGKARRLRAWTVKYKDDPLCTPELLQRLDDLADEPDETTKPIFLPGSSGTVLADQANRGLRLAIFGGIVVVGLAGAAAAGYFLTGSSSPAAPTADQYARAQVEACFNPKGWEDALHCYTVAEHLYNGNKSASNATDALAILAASAKFTHDHTTDADILRAQINVDQGNKEKACEVLKSASNDPDLDQRKIANALKSFGC